jgi:hypothetical protein
LGIENGGVIGSGNGGGTTGQWSDLEFRSDRIIYILVCYRSLARDDSLQARHLCTFMEIFLRNLVELKNLKEKKFVCP